MYTYIDETGNTGTNIFDKTQPIFLTIALITRSDFDLQYQKQFTKLARIIGKTSLHANSIGIEKLESIADDLLQILEHSHALFFVSTVEKIFFAHAKLFDTVFDPFDNLAVPDYVYNAKPMRLLLLSKFAILVEENDLQEFWQYIILRKSTESINGIKAVLQRIFQRTNKLPDTRSQEIISQSIQWFIDHLDSIDPFAENKFLKTLQSPNVAAFLPLLQGIQQQSVAWNLPVKQIVHDRQSQFESAFTEIPKRYSKAKPQTFNMSPFDIFQVPLAPNSNFQIVCSDESPGIQMVDIVQWLWQKYKKGIELPIGCFKLITYFSRNSSEWDQSFLSAEIVVDEFLKPDLEISAEESKRALSYLQSSERERLKRMYTNMDN